MATYEITAELDLKKIIAESREAAEALNEFADNLEQRGYMNIERNCQSCKYYKDGYCKNLELKPCYPQKGCDDFSKRNELKNNTIQVLDKIRAEIEDLKFGQPLRKFVVDECLEIIDKYKAESEE